MYTVFDRALLPRIGNLPNGLHTDLKFQNQAIQCCLFEPRGVKYDRAVGREREIATVKYDRAVGREREIATYI